MKKEDLFETLGGINEQYIREAHMKKSRRKSNGWTKWATVAACLAVVLVTGIPTAKYFSNTGDENIPGTENVQKETTSYPMVEKESAHEQSGVENLRETIGSEESNEDVENTGTEEHDITTEDDQKTTETTPGDAPGDANGTYMEAVGSEDLTKDEAEFFGGSYLDENGKFNIVLTEDTPENRTLICKKLGVSEGNTTFQKGEYTLAYLTELQAKISNAMINKEIPFVVTSSVSETINRIKVGVTTDDEAELAKVYALDSIGGAIVIEKSAGVATKDLLVPKAELEE